MSQSPLNLEGKVAVVVGGTSGIGRALSIGLAEAGADVVASARRAEQVESTAVEIEAKGRRTLRVTSDVSNRASLQNLLDQTLTYLGKADILINCAGKIKRAPTLTFPEDEWQSILDINLTGTLRLPGDKSISHRYALLSDEEATAHLDLMNKIGHLPWKLTFSYGRALQHAPQKAWSGKSENVAAAQRVFAHRAAMNGLASKGQWKQDLEKKAA